MPRPPVLLRAPCPTCGSGVGVYCVSKWNTPVYAGHKTRRDAAALLPPVALIVTTTDEETLILTERREGYLCARAKGSERQIRLTLAQLSEESQALVSTLPVGWTAKAARALATEGS